eukprot:TRINITY_DN36942_c0_g1_i1.p1 TRINITY_DN36942_c0_g1~~TRINITY_DN36942_c0_g1_i1.p1  ORF type:complete len:350 (-),score=83.11 TRINITY_DN36942_c0_g1_i1:297-1346(-)
MAIRAKAAFEESNGGDDPGIDDGTFRVIVIVPNFPEGAVTDTAVQVVLHYTLMTLNGVDVPGTRVHDDAQRVGSLVKRVKVACKEYLGNSERWHEFLSVNCLRNHAEFGEIPVMNQIYVHAKLMIVDDRICICGSANINERSQLGDRDSELAYRIMPCTDKRGDLEIQMNGKRHMATAFAHSLRRSLWAEHLGIEDALSGKPVCFVDDTLGDPVCDRNYKDQWLAVARSNSKICNTYFLEQPANHHDDLETYDRCRRVADHEINGDSQEAESLRDSEKRRGSYEQNKEKLLSEVGLHWRSRAEAREHARRLQGHLYEYPLKFLWKDLEDGKLLPSFTDAENVVPLMTFT